MQDARSIREKAIREAKINLILDAARKVFAEKGFYDARLEDIAAEAGFSKASLYNYYDDKEAIFLNLAVREYVELNARLDEAFNEEERLEENLRRMLNLMFSTFGEHFAIILAISSFRMTHLVNLEEIYARHREYAGEFKKQFSRINDLLIALIGRARERGEVTAPLNDSKCASFLGSLVRGVLFEWKIAGKMGNIEEAVDEILLFLHHGLGMVSPK